MIRMPFATHTKVIIMCASVAVVVLVIAISNGWFAAKPALADQRTLLGSWTADGDALERHIAAFPPPVQERWRARAQEWLRSTVHIDEQSIEIRRPGRELRRPYRVISTGSDGVLVELDEPTEQLSIGLGDGGMTWTAPDLTMSFWSPLPPPSPSP